MVLIKSISGIRGTIHEDDSGLSSLEIRQSVCQFFLWLKSRYNQSSPMKIAVGRDGRISGEGILNLISSLLLKNGIDLLNMGLTTTPSVQMAVVTENCVAGIMISASHNPSNWNGLKFLNQKGEFLSKKEGLEVFNFSYDINSFTQNNIIPGFYHEIEYLDSHIASILNLKDVEVDKIRNRNFKIVVDGINSSGGIYVPFLLSKLGVNIIKLNCTPNGVFAHNPEPSPVNLIDLCSQVREHKADIGIAVDPDVDRLVFVCEDGTCLSEEYTIVAISQYILSKYSNSTVVSNLSTTKALRDIALDLNAHQQAAITHGP